MNLCDVNIYLYAYREDSPHHAFYKRWLEEELLKGELFAFSEVVLSAFLRIATHPKVFDPPSDLESALRFTNQIRNHPGAVPIFGEGKGGQWDWFQDICRRYSVTGNGVPDAYLAALAIDVGLKFVTADRGFIKFEELDCFILRP